MELAQFIQHLQHDGYWRIVLPDKGEIILKPYRLDSIANGIEKTEPFRKYWLFEGTYLLKGHEEYLRVLVYRILMHQGEIIIDLPQLGECYFHEISPEESLIFRNADGERIIFQKQLVLRPQAI